MRKEVFTCDEGWPANPDKREHFVYDGWTLDAPRLAGRDGLQGSLGASPIAASQGWNVVMVLNGIEENEVARQWLPAGICAVIVVLGSIILARHWYRRLPAAT